MDLGGGVLTMDELARSVVAHGDDAEIRAILEEVCRVTGMGFAAVARVTDDRWIAAQVCDTMRFGLKPGDELDIKRTICEEIRGHGREVFIDHVSLDESWRDHPVPALYNFESYFSIPLILQDGSFYGTMCGVDPAPRNVTEPRMVATLTAFAIRIALLIAAKPSVRLN